MTIREFINCNFKKELKSDHELPFKVKRKSFRKGEIITAYGRIERNAYFLMEGLIEVTA